MIYEIERSQLKFKNKNIPSCMENILLSKENSNFQKKKKQYIVMIQNYYYNHLIGIFFFHIILFYFKFEDYSLIVIYPLIRLSPD